MYLILLYKVFYCILLYLVTPVQLFLSFLFCNILHTPSIRVANFQTLVCDLRLFVILQTFLLLFLYMLKTKTFCTSHHKTTSNHPRIQDFRDFRQKPEKRSHSVGSSCAGPWPAVTLTLSTSQSFQTF